MKKITTLGTPEKFLNLLNRCFSKKDLTSFADLFATDGVLELPFSTDKSKRFIQGRENIRAYLAGVDKSSLASLRPTGYQSMTISKQLI